MASEIAVFAGGCFWCMAPVFTQLQGVLAVRSGYVGGQLANPSYKAVCRGDTGHAEAVEIVFDNAQVSFDTLLEIFFVSHDPTTRNRQGNDIGTQYRSAVFCQNEAQTLATHAMIDALNSAFLFNAPIVTEVNTAAMFYPAEDEHQDYYARNPQQPYCVAVAGPKVAKIRAKYSALLRE